MYATETSVVKGVPKITILLTDGSQTRGDGSAIPPHEIADDMRALGLK